MYIKQDKGRVVLGPVRLSHVHLLEKHSFDNGEPMFSCVPLIPKTDTEAVAALRRYIDSVKKQAANEKWGGKVPANYRDPLRDGDEKYADTGDAAWQGCLFFNCKCKTRPGVVGKQNEPLVDEEEVYSGMWAYVSTTAFAYDRNGNRGVSLGLNNVKKVRDGERLGGRMSAEADFGGVPAVDDEDDL